MTPQDSANEGKCIPPEVIMALLDGELSPSERERAEAHLADCPRCRRLSESLRETSRDLSDELACLDDEDIVAYVDHVRGEGTGRLTDRQRKRREQHLAECADCRELVEAAMRDDTSHVCALDLIRLVFSRITGSAARPGSLVPVWAAAGAIAVLALLVLALWPGRRHVAPESDAVVARAPTSGSPNSVAMPQPSRDGAVQPSHTEPGASADAAAGDVQPLDSQPSQSSSPVTVPQTAFVPSQHDDAGELSAAMAELEEAKESGDHDRAAAAAGRVAAVYHRSRDYESAARYYREAADAAAEAGEIEVRVDSLVFLGAVLAEAGETEKAREELSRALDLAGEIDYERGVRNARLQIRLLGEPPSGTEQ